MVGAQETLEAIIIIIIIIIITIIIIIARSLIGPGSILR